MAKVRGKFNDLQRKNWSQDAKSVPTRRSCIAYISHPYILQGFMVGVEYPICNNFCVRGRRECREGDQCNQYALVRVPSQGTSKTPD